MTTQKELDEKAKILLKALHNVGVFKYPYYHPPDGSKSFPVKNFFEMKPTSDIHLQDKLALALGAGGLMTSGVKVAKQIVEEELNLALNDLGYMVLVFEEKKDLLRLLLKILRRLGVEVE